jgi:hypothetical protein
MKKILSAFLLIIAIVTTTSLSAQQQALTVHCEKELIHYWNTLQQAPGVKELVENILKEGPITIKANHNVLSQQFGAFWDLDRRIICVDVSVGRSSGDIIGSILFELHNAAATSRLNRLDDLAVEGKLDKENYVRAVEHVEYLNSLNASKIASEEIHKGVFPATAYLPTYRNFEEHYYYQKRGGHSAWIARNYDHLRINK